MTIDFTKKEIPSSPGVYFFKDTNGNILYIGKAANLKQRLSSYFQKNMYLEPAKKRMVEEAKAVTWRMMTSEVEALIEEARLIKNSRPKYNILMRDDKNYLFVGFTREKFPRITFTHQPVVYAQIGKQKHRANYIGPFTDAGIIKKALRSLRRVFPYCTCKQLHSRPCQASELRLCYGACCLKDTPLSRKERQAYIHNIKSINKILLGKRTQLIKRLQKEMAERSKAKDFETAARLRDQIRGLERIFAHSPFLKKEHTVENEKALRELMMILGLKGYPRRIEGYDISNIQGKYAAGSMVVFTNGVSDKNEYRKFRIRTVREANDVAMLREVLARRFRNIAWPEPDVMLIDGGRPQLNAALAVQNHVPRRKNIKIIAIAKREEELYIENKRSPIRLKETSTSLLHLLQQIRNEAHRFAISYYRKLHSTLN